MRTIETTVFKFEELDESAKENARQWWRDDLEFSWSDESLDSINAFCSNFGVRLKEYSVSVCSSIDYSTDATNAHFRGLKLSSVNRDNMPTGYCLDCSLWFTFHDEFKRTGNALAAFESAMDAGFKAWRGDMEYQLSDESVDEMLTINEYEFTENGKPS